MTLEYCILGNCTMLIMAKLVVDLQRYSSTRPLVATISTYMMKWECFDQIEIHSKRNFEPEYL